MSKIRRRLEESLNNGRIATVVRDAFEMTMTDGFVVALTDEWLVMHVLDGVYLDDLVILRRRDISQVWFRDDDAYHHRAIRSLGEDVKNFECEGIASVSDLVNAASMQADIFAIYQETRDGEPLFIGRPVKLRKKSFDFHYIGRDGVWADHVDRLKYRHLTRIEIGGRYLDALNRFGDPYPVAAEVE